MSIIVFYLTLPDLAPECCTFLDSELSEALQACKDLRESGQKHVVLSSEPGDMVGKPGVDSIVDGKTPDGQDYTWSKAGRAGKTRRGDENREVRDGKKL